MRNYFVYDMPIGPMFIAEEDGKLCDIDINKPDHYENTKERGELREKETVLIREAARQLREYFAGERKAFDLPIKMSGTDFQLRAWEALRAIPYGETRSYREQADAAGSPKACRAIGGANHRNRLLIVVPCHRVIGADGSLVGFGSGLDVKAQLLALEMAYKG